jgi:hypothetical protein
MSLETDLNRRYVDRWLEDMRERFMKEVRFDVGTGSREQGIAAACRSL